MASLVVEAPRSILDAPRTLLLESLCGWIETQEEFASLPDAEIVVSVLNRPYLPPRYSGRGREAVGCFAATVSGRLNPVWEVAIAYGTALEDVYELEAWTVTLAHELLHLDAFATANASKVPASAGLDAILNQTANEGVIENRARDITDRFQTTHAALFDDPTLLLAIGDLAAPSL